MVKMNTMKVYSETIFSFIQKANKMLRDILVKETSFQVRRSRFEYQGYLYPIDVVIFEGDLIGYFDAAHFQIGLNKNLIHQAKDNLIKDILRHELAHYITHLFYGEKVKAHGNEFQHVCNLFNWPDDIKKASMNFEIANANAKSFHSEKILNKVKNLLKLAESSNAHEAELATLKANQLLIKHNLEFSEMNSDQEFYVMKLLSRKRKDAKISAIYDILKHFMVKPIISYGKNEVCIEVTGSKTNIELAQYISAFLNRELDRLWDVFKSEHKLKGLKAKNSFFYGMAQGYNEKVNKMEFPEKDRTALVKINKHLDDQVDRIYRRLSSSRSQNTRDNESFGLGRKAGANLTIHQGVKNNTTKKYLEY